MELTKELTNKLLKAKSVDDVLKLAKEEGIDINMEDAKNLFNTLSNKLSDDELDKVAGGLNPYCLKKAPEKLGK